MKTSVKLQAGGPQAAKSGASARTRFRATSATVTSTSHRGFGHPLFFWASMCTLNKRIGTITTVWEYRAIMTKVFIFLATFGAFALMCQWFAVSRVRRYLFERYEPVSRKFAYTLLFIVGFINVAMLKLIFDASYLSPESFAQRIMAVGYFTYLGCILALCLLFLLLGLISSGLDLTGWVISRIKSVARSAGTGPSSPAKSEDTAAEKESHNSREGTLLVTRLTGSRVVPAPNTSRRAFLRWSAAAGLVATLGTAGSGIVHAYRKPDVEEFDVVHPALAGLNHDITLIHVTDLHYGMFFGPAELERLAAHLNSIEADALLMAGDIFHSPLTPIESAESGLKKLRPRKYGNFAVMGNHDFYAGEHLSVQTMEKSGIRLLRNQWLTFEEGPARVHLGGIDDPMANWIFGKRFPSYPAFIEKAPESPGIKILLSHRPSVFPIASADGVDIVLAGHIHGGQVVLPCPGHDRGLSLAGLVSPYIYGWYGTGKSRMFLSSGVGLTFVPWRVNCPPEIAVFHLKPPGLLSDEKGGDVRVTRTQSLVSSTCEPPGKLGIT
jgi:uncharacterized protein